MDAERGAAPAGHAPPGSPPASAHRIGDWLRQLRRARGLSQGELAARLGYSVETVRAVEARGHRPSRDLAAALAAWLALPPDEVGRFTAWARGSADVAVPAALRPLLARAARTAADGAPVRSTELPVPATSLIGRAADLADLVPRLLDPAARLVTLIGPPGVGKTRLALAAAAAAEADPDGRFPDGAHFVSLAGVREPEVVALTIARRLRVRDSSGRPAPERLAVALRRKALLLVLDNVEQVLEAVPMVGELLAACTGVTVLATSREPLRASGEQLVGVAPLALPEPRDQLSIDGLAGTSAVALFVARGRAARRRFALSTDNAAAVAGIVRLLDGLPLSIELAAARVTHLHPRTLLAQLEGARWRGEALSVGPRDAPARHRTLESAIAWSVDLLTEGEQRLFRWLSVFAGGAGVDAAVAVCADDPPAAGRGATLDAAAVRAGLEQLANKHLIVLTDDGAAAPEGVRVHMLETLREYAAVRLAESGEAADARRRHAAHVLALAERAGPELHGPDQVRWLDRLEREHANLRAALRWALDAPDRAGDTAVRICAAIWEFWWIRGSIREGRDWLESVLARRGEGPAWADVLGGAGILCGLCGEDDRALRHWADGRAMARGLRDPAREWLNLVGPALTASQVGDVAEAERLFALSLEAARRGGRRLQEGVSLHRLGILRAWTGRIAEGIATMDDGLRVLREIGDRRGVAYSYWESAHILTGVDLAAAHARSRAGLVLFREVRDVWGMAWSLLTAGQILLRNGAADEAARAFGAGLAGAEQCGIADLRVHPGWRFYFVVHEAAMVAATEALGRDAYARALAAGRRMPIEAAIARVLAAPGWSELASQEAVP